MKNINRRNFFKVSIGSAAVLSMPKTFANESVPYADLKSKEISAMFGESSDNVFRKRIQCRKCQYKYHG